MNRARILAIAAALAALHGSKAQAVDTSWDSTRHLEHFGGSALIAGVATKLAGSEQDGAWIAFGIGASKEVIDHFTPGAACTLKSLAMDAAGAYIGAKVAGLVIEPRPHGFSLVLTRRF